MDLTISERIHQYLENKRTEYENDLSLLMKDLTDLLLQQTKKELEENPSLLVTKYNAVEKENINPEFYSAQEMEEIERTIEKEFEHPDNWKILNLFDFEYTIIDPLCVWKREYSFLRSDLRYCMSDLCVGFQNHSDKVLEFTLEKEGQDASEEIIRLEPEEILRLEKPIWFSKHLFTTFRIREPSHEQFSSLLVWLPLPKKKVPE
jgi:hypothetical protein